MGPQSNDTVVPFQSGAEPAPQLGFPLQSSLGDLLDQILGLHLDRGELARQRGLKGGIVRSRLPREGEGEFQALRLPEDRELDAIGFKGRERGMLLGQSRET